MAVSWVVAPCSLVEVMPGYTTLQPRKQPSSYSPPWEPEILLTYFHSCIFEEPFFAPSYARRHMFALSCFLFTVSSFFYCVRLFIFGSCAGSVFFTFFREVLKLVHITVLRASQFASQILSVIALNLWSVLVRGSSFSVREEALQTGRLYFALLSFHVNRI
jgi:hypothetical protein